MCIQSSYTLLLDCESIAQTCKKTAALTPAASASQFNPQSAAVFSQMFFLFFCFFKCTHLASLTKPVSTRSSIFLLFFSKKQRLGSQE